MSLHNIPLFLKCCFISFTLAYFTTLETKKSLLGGGAALMVELAPAPTIGSGLFLHCMSRTDYHFRCSPSESLVVGGGGVDFIDEI